MMGWMSDIPRTTPPFQIRKATKDMIRRIYGQSRAARSKGRKRAATTILMAQRIKSTHVSGHHKLDLGILTRHTSIFKTRVMNNTTTVFFELEHCSLPPGCRDFHLAVWLSCIGLDDPDQLEGADKYSNPEYIGLPHG